MRTHPPATPARKNQIRKRVRPKGRLRTRCLFMHGGYDCDMLRRSFTFASAISLLLWVAAGVLWVATYGDALAVGFKTREAGAKQAYPVPVDYRVVSANSHLWLQRRRGEFGMPPDFVANEYPSKAGERRWSLNRADEKFPLPAPGPTMLERLGFLQEHVAWWHQGAVDSVDEIIVPLWPIVCVLALLPLAWLGAHIWNSKGRRNPFPFRVSSIL